MSDETRLITVFGGTGFIGHHLVTLLLQRARYVRLVTRRGAGASPPHPRLTLVRADLSDEQSLRSAVAGSSVVFGLDSIEITKQRIGAPSKVTSSSAPSVADGTSAVTLPNSMERSGGVELVRPDVAANFVY